MSLDPRSPFSTYHPLAGKIAAGVKTTATARARLPHQSMALQEMPTVTMADRAQQMFSMTDKKGTRVYYSNTGVFNTNDELGKPINFIGGLFKTTESAVIRFLQQFVEQNMIHYLELQEDAEDARPELQVRDEHERSQGSGSSLEEPNEPDQPEPQFGLQISSDTDRPERSREPSKHEQSSNRPAIRSSDRDRDDQQEPGRADNPDGQGEHTVAKKPSALELLKKGK